MTFLAASIAFATRDRGYGMVHDQTYYLALTNETLGKNPALGPWLRTIWQKHRVTDACGLYDGASLWHSNGALHVRVVRSSKGGGLVDVVDVVDALEETFLASSHPG